MLLVVILDNQLPRNGGSVIAVPNLERIGILLNHSTLLVVLEGNVIPELKGAFVPIGNHEVDHAIGAIHNLDLLVYLVPLFVEGAFINAVPAIRDFSDAEWPFRSRLPLFAAEEPSVGIVFEVQIMILFFLIPPRSVF